MTFCDPDPAPSVIMVATASMWVRPGNFPAPLEEQILSVLGEDPILLGASGYLDTIFTTRLVGTVE